MRFSAPDAFVEAYLGLKEVAANRRVTLGLLTVAVLAYLPEMANPTYSSDYFYDIIWSRNTGYAFSSAARYFAELLRLATQKMFPPTLLLIIGLTLLAVAAVLFALIVGIRDRLIIFGTAALFLVFPLFFETFAYHPLRDTVPLAVVLSLLAVWRPNIVLGAILFFLALNLYQSATYCAVIATIFLAAQQSQSGLELKPLILSAILPRAVAFVIGLVAYGVFVKLYSPYGPVPANMLEGLARPPHSLSELLQTAHLVGLAAFELFTRDEFLFPVLAKAIFGVIFVATIIGLAARRCLIALILLLIAPIFVFGAAWTVFPANYMMTDRVLFPFSFIYTGTILLSWGSLTRLRPYLLAGTFALVAIFVYQANLWHQYMDMKNRADMDMSSKIAEQVLANPSYHSWMPLAIVGTQTPADYLPFWQQDISRGVIQNSSLPSVFSQAWSASRELMFYVRFSGASPAQQAAATSTATTMPAWPLPGSIVIKDGVIVLKLS